MVAVGLVALVLAGCSRVVKEEIPLVYGQTYDVQSSGKATVYPPGGIAGKQGAQLLRHLRVKRKNIGADAKTDGCWRCSDCICMSDDCSCTECTSC